MMGSKYSTFRKFIHMYQFIHNYYYTTKVVEM